NGNDFTRIARQQSLVAAAWDQLRGPSLVRRLPNLLRLANGVTIDAGLGIDDIVDLVKAFKDVAAGRVEGHLLPTVDRRVGRAQVLGISYSRALPLYERLRSWPPGSHDAPASASEEPSAEGSSAPTASDEPSAAASPSASPAPQQPAPAAAIPSTNCTRSQAFELPPNPLDYLANIADGDPTPYYRPTQSRPREEPSDDESSDPESGGPDEPSDPSASESDPDPSASEPEPGPSESESESEPRDLLPTPEPHDDDGDRQDGTARGAGA
ncbi:MAG: hypothetical protein ACI867_002121, partial [Glaciecola sp.]